jgi:hypothetical protein
MASALCSEGLVALLGDNTKATSVGITWVLVGSKEPDQRIKLATTKIERAAIAIKESTRARTKTLRCSNLSSNRASL